MTKKTSFTSSRQFGKEVVKIIAFSDTWNRGEVIGNIPDFLIKTYHNCFLISDTIHRLIFVYSFLIFNAEQLLNDRQKLNAS